MSNFTKLMAQAASGNAGGGEFYDYTIDNSVRFEDGGDAKAYRTHSTPTSDQRFTYSTWFKHANVTTNAGVLFYVRNSAWNRYFAIFAYPPSGSYDGRIAISCNPNGTIQDVYPSALFRDFSAWYHLVLAVDSTEATATDRVKVYINGERVTDWISGTAPNNVTLNQSIASLQSGGITSIGGRDDVSSVQMYDGYLSQTAFIDGTAYAATDFGESKNGVWIPKDISGLSFGNNGYHLDYADSSAFGNDVSGNNNDLTTNGFASNDQMPDTPTNNFMVGNTLVAHTGNSQYNTEGNLQANCWDQINYGQGFPKSGKWYFELQGVNTYNAGGYVLYPGVVVGLPSSSQNNWSSDGLNQVVYMIFNNPQQPSRVYSNGAWSNTSSTGASGSIPNNTVIGFAIDMDNGQIDSYVGGTLDHQLTLSATELATKDVRLVMQGASNTGVYNIMDLNFGQNGTFNGRKTAQGNSDENGYGDFYYTPPSGYLAVCSQNMPEPTIGPNSDTTSGENFNTVLWTGDQSARTITGYGFQPDFLWTKSRSTAESHRLHDAVRGGNGTVLYELKSDSSTTDQGTDTQVSGFTTDGFTMTAGGNSPNVTGRTYVGWGWKGNNSTSSNTDGDVTSTVSANTDAGISICTFTTPSTAQGFTVGHGLGVAPDFLILRGLQTYRAWWVWHKDFSPTYYYLYLHGSQAFSGLTQSTNAWNNAVPTSTVFSTRSDWQYGTNTPVVAYAFAEVEGFSKFGSYTGNGSSDGPFVYTGFRPAWVMIKRTDSANSWTIMDDKRDTYNYADSILWADLSDAEASGGTTTSEDFLSNGFKLRGAGGSINASGGSYIYMAFAENPFKYSNAR